MKHTDAWDRALLILAEENPTAHDIFALATAHDAGGGELQLSFPAPSTPFERFAVDTATRGLLDTTLDNALERATAELGFGMLSVNLVVPKPDEEPEPEPTIEDFTRAQRAAAAAYKVGQISARMIQRAAEENPDAILEICDELDIVAVAKKDPSTATGYQPHVEQRFRERLVALIGEGKLVIKRDESTFSETYLDDDTTRPSYYGGPSDPYEVVKVWRDLGMGPAAHYATALKYMRRAGKKGDQELADLRKAQWYLNAALEHGYTWERPSSSGMIPTDVVLAWGLTGHLADAALSIIREEPVERALAALNEHIHRREEQLGA